ncbi:MAG TPA: hypothetical protein VG406_23770 [Isosphaeraceae bacterium]|jgi:hypothetical protein|nr:hypothetical protein [Isosphaeraceae bacterium]
MFGLNDWLTNALLAELAFLVLAVVFTALLRRRGVRKFRASLEKGYPPPRIRLARNDALVWKNPGKLRAMVASLETLGFEDAGTFELEGRPGHRMKGMVKPSESITAQIYEQPILGIYLSFFTRYRDGSSLTYTNISGRGIMPDRPGFDRVRLPGLDATHLYLRFVNERRQGLMRPMTAGEYAGDFEALYADLMDWMAARGGYTLEEIRAARLRFGLRIAPRFAQVAVEILSRKAAESLDWILRDRFAAEHGLRADERDRLIVVHDRLGLDVAAALFAREAGVDAAEARTNPLIASPRAAFAELNDRLPESHRLALLGSLDEPVAADFYGHDGADDVIPIEDVMLNEG